MSNNDIFEMDSVCDTEEMDGDMELGMIDEDMVYPEEFLPTYHSIEEGATVNKARLVSLHMLSATVAAHQSKALFVERVWIDSFK
ncbi:Anthranilate phosphoribosyltransferase [Dissostichus eleginoides]|uniref:Anthranilate phosphoribosyltransferase n=1 Tax=Dissostichus eleginoides TaxID=100907 RepID=A0AAD9CQX9_DISEL|nr:Anthranilate phosphoribosyltransferase [Dissostichus eleginoides]